MQLTTLVVGSLDALESCDEDGAFVDWWRDADVVVLPTAGAFSSLEQTALRSAAPFAARGARVEALMVGDRAAADGAHFAGRIEQADVVVLSDGAPLHARSVWRSTLVGGALARARCLVAVGATATVLGATMIDPRGGAPTTGLGLRAGVVITPSGPADQLARTRSLLEADVTLATVGPSGVLMEVAGRWRSRHAVVTTRGMSEWRGEF